MKNRENIKSWLEEMDYFEFSILLEVEEDPLSITLGYSHQDDIKLYNRVKLIPKNIENWTFNKSKKFFPSATTEIRHVELLDNSSSNIHLKLVHSFNEVILECQATEFEELTPIAITPKLRFNETWVTLSLPPQQSIEPKYWLETLSDKKIQASFRLYGGEAKEIDKIATNYTGYSIAKDDRLKHNPTGIFVSASKTTTESTYVLAIINLN